MWQRFQAFATTAALTGAEGRDIDLSGAKVGPCPNCGADGKVPEGTYDLIFDTLRVAKEAAIEKVIFDAIIEVLEDRAAGKVTDADVMERVEATVPGLAPTVKGYLAKSDPASWIAMLISILMLLQSSSAPSPPSAEEIAAAIWAKETPAKVAPAAPAADKPTTRGRGRPRGKRPPKAHGRRSSERLESAANASRGNGQRDDGDDLRSGRHRQCHPTLRAFAATRSRSRSALFFDPHFSSGSMWHHEQIFTS